MELYRKVTTFINVMEHPPTLVEDTKTSLELTNGSRIVCLPGSEATVRCYSAVNLIVEDEVARVSDAFNMATRPMLAVSGGRLIELSTPFGKRGHFYNTWSKQFANWHRINITADECSRIPKEFLETELLEIGQWWYAQEYQNVFNDQLDSFFISQVIESAFITGVEPLLGHLSFDEFMRSHSSSTPPVR